MFFRWPPRPATNHYKLMNKLSTNSWVTVVLRGYIMILQQYCCKFSNNQIENYFFLAANREVQLNNQFYKTTRELRTLFKNILERRRLRSANSLKKKHWGSARDPRTWQKNPSGANTCEPRAQAEFFQHFLASVSNSCFDHTTKDSDGNSWPVLTALVFEPKVSHVCSQKPPAQIAFLFD